MNITPISNEQVKNDESARKTSDSALARLEEEANERRRKLNKHSVEIDVKQVLE